MDTVLSKEQRIIAAAEQVFSQHGFEKSTVDEIIALAEVGKGTLYKYFGNKEQLFYNLVLKKNSLFVERLDAAVKHGNSLEQKMLAFFVEMITFYKTNAALWQIICFEMLGGSTGFFVHTVKGVPMVFSRYKLEASEEMREQMVRYHLILESEYRILQGLLEEGIRTGELKKIDAEIDTIYVFFGVAMCIFHSHEIIDRTTPKKMAQGVIDRVLYGIAK